MVTLLHIFQNVRYLVGTYELARGVESLAVFKP